MTIRFTKSELVEQFARVGFRPNALRGQCFLADLNMLDAVVESAALEPTDMVLEIGCGPGNLTAEVASVAKLVVVVPSPGPDRSIAGQSHCKAVASGYFLNST